MIKQYKEQFKLTIQAGQANASPPIGPMLGQRGINIMEFSKEFNSLTKHFKDNIPIPVFITFNKNRSLSLNIQTPLSSFILKSLAYIQKGSPHAKNQIIGSLNIKHLYEFINLITKSHHKKYCKIFIATAKSMGLNIIK
jgi:large subunit ribosomal protein L11